VPPPTPVYQYIRSIIWRKELEAREREGKCRTSITDNEVISNFQMIRLDRLQCIHGCSLRLTDQFQIASVPHTRFLRRLKCCIFRCIAPNSGHSEHELHLCHSHKRLAISSCKCFHCVLVYLRQVVRHRFYNRLLILSKLCGGFEGRDEVWQFVILLVEEELYAS
jgi:hypothetical protein